MLKDLTPNWEEIKKNSLRWKELQDQGYRTALIAAITFVIAGITSLHLR